MRPRCLLLLPLLMLLELQTLLLESLLQRLLNEATLKRWRGRKVGERGERFVGGDLYGRWGLRGRRVVENPERNGAEGRRGVGH